jgi:hypothetical protein
MSEAKLAYLKKEIIENLKETGLLIGINGSPAVISKKDDQYFVHTTNGKGLLYSGNEEEMLSYLVTAYTA